MLVKDTVCAVHVEQEPIKNHTGESLVTMSGSARPPPNYSSWRLVFYERVLHQATTIKY